MNHNQLEYLLQPIQWDTFFQQYWDRDYCVISRNDPAYYSHILTVKQIDDLLCQPDLFFPMVRLVQQGKNVPQQTYVNLQDASNVVRQDAVFSHFYQGASIVFQFMKYRMTSIAEFCCDLENFLKFNVEANVYLSPRNAQGFSCHYDAHNVFILQIFGTKKWRLFGEFANLPTPDQKFNQQSSTPQPLLREIELQPGDLLYIPRGYGHEASTSDDISLHITLSLFPYLWLDIVKEAMNANKDNGIYAQTPSPFLSDESFRAKLETILVSLGEISAGLSVESLIKRQESKKLDTTKYFF